MRVPWLPSPQFKRRAKSRVLRLAYLAGATLVACSGDLERDPAPHVVAFVDVNVVPMNAEVVLPAHTVIVEGSRIAALGRSSEVLVPPGAVRIDGSGHFLMPGLVDMHVHLGDEEEFLPFVANGVTTVRNMWGNPPATAWREQIESGELLGPTIFTSGPIVDGDPPWFEGSIVLTDAAEAAGVVAEHKREGYDFVKILPGLSPEVFDALLEAAAAEDIPVVGHVPDSVDLNHALSSGMASMEELEGYAQALMADGAGPFGPATRLVGWAYFDSEKLPGIVRATVEAGTWITPVLFSIDRILYEPGEFDERLEGASPQYMHPEHLASWRRRVPPPEIVQDARRGFPRRLTLVKALHDAGVPILLGTDCPNPFVPFGFAVHDELHLLVQAGLTPYEALRAATVKPAEFLGQADEFGVIAAGRRADLILVRGDPLEDVTHASERVGVMLRGIWLSEEELQSRMDALAQQLAALGETPTDASPANQR